MAKDSIDWAIALFDRSVLKQEKYRQIRSLLGTTEGKRCLDVGADNGVISYLLRERGGHWSSVDLDAHTVASIRDLVGSEVFQIDGRGTPFPDHCFDVVVVVDLLEHVHTDREFVRDLHRVLKPGGTLIVNVPHIKRRSLLNWIRPRIGLTDEKHGHVRPGYSRDDLTAVLGDRFAIRESRTYSGSFSEGIDTALNGVYELLGALKKGKRESAKGTVITGAEWKRFRKEFRLLGMVYPLFWLFSRLDRLLVLQQGYKLIVRAEAQLTHPPLEAPKSTLSGVHA